MREPARPAPFMSPALWVGWLLREDGRGGAALDDEAAQRDFAAWWLLIGRREHPAAPELPPAALAVAQEPVAVGPDASLPRFMAMAWRANPGLAERFDLAAPRDHARFLAWFCLVAVPQYAVQDYMPLTALGGLFAPDEATAHLASRPLNRLERFVWDTVPALAERFDIAAVDGQEAFLRWFQADGADSCGLAWLFRAPPAPVVVPMRRPDLQPGGLNLIGFAYGQLGVGEDVRMLAASCTAAAIPFRVVPLVPVGERGPPDRWLEPAAADGPVFDTSILCMTGFDTGLQRLEAPRVLDPAAYRIGYWPWELPHWPGAWQCAFDVIDEVWASSRYTQAAYEEATSLPVRLMRMAVSVERILPKSRRDLGLPADRLLFLYVFDAHSYLARKNPEAAIAAFRKAFPTGREPVGLVLKVMGGDRSDPGFAHFLDAVGGDPRVTLIDGVLPRGEVLGLIAACDIYVSLHRAEGFGRTIAEAMLLRRPVVATGFSGSDELVGPETALAVGWGRRPVGPDEYPFGDGQWWAEPDIDHAAWCLRTLAKRPALRARLAEAAYRHVRRNHRPEIVGARYAARLAEIRRA